MHKIEYALDSICERVYVSAMQDTLAIFASLSDPSRLRALALISREKELCVCELVGALDLSQPKVSRHMRVLSDAGLVVGRRDAQWVIYRLNPDLPAWAQKALGAAIEAVNRDAQHRQDKKRLKSVCRPLRSKPGKAA